MPVAQRLPYVEILFEKGRNMSRFQIGQLSFLAILGIFVVANQFSGAIDDSQKHLGVLRDKATIFDFGAVGDGKTDDTAAIQKAVDSGIGNIVFPRGTYRLTKTVAIDLDRVGFTSLVGQGTPTIVMTGPGPAFRFVGTHGGTADPTSAKPNVWKNERMPMVEGLAITGEHEQADAIEATGTMQLTVTRTNIRGVRHGVHLIERNRNVLIANCHIYHNTGAGVYLDHVNLHQTNINGCHISYNGAGGVVVRGGEVRNVHINGCDIEANMAKDGPPSANVWFDCADGSIAEAAIVGCTIQHESKSAHSANIRVQGQGVFLRKGEKVVVNCGHITIADNVLSDVKVNIELRGARGVTIVGNTFWQGYEHNLLVEDCSQIVVGPNAMERNPMYGYTTEANNAVVFRNSRDCTLSGMHVHNVQQSEAGIVLENCQRFNVTNCTVLDCEGGGLLLKQVQNSRVSDCLIRDDRAMPEKNACLRVLGGSGNMVVDNLTSDESTPTK